MFLCQLLLIVMLMLGIDFSTLGQSSTSVAFAIIVTLIVAVNVRTQVCGLLQTHRYARSRWDCVAVPCDDTTVSPVQSQGPHVQHWRLAPSSPASGTALKPQRPRRKHDTSPAPAFSTVLWSIRITAVIKNPNFFLLRTALKDRPPGPTANRQPLRTTANRQLPPTANCQPPPTNRQPLVSTVSVVVCLALVLTMKHLKWGPKVWRGCPRERSFLLATPFFSPFRTALIRIPRPRSLHCRTGVRHDGAPVPHPTGYV